MPESSAEVAKRLLTETPDLTAAERAHLEAVVAGQSMLLLFRNTFTRTTPSPVTADELRDILGRDDFTLDLEGSVDPEALAAWINRRFGVAP